MFQNNPLLAQLKQQLHDAIPRISGIVKIHEKGFGFLESENKKSYFIPATKMKLLLHGDKVEGQILLHEGKESFDPEKVLESAFTEFIGKMDYLDSHWMVYPKCSLNNRPIRCHIKKGLEEKIEPGCWVHGIVTSRPLQAQGRFFTAEITEFITKGDDAAWLWLTTLRRYHLPYTTPALTAPLSLLSGEEQDRKDLTHLPFFSIDNEDTKDVDDTFCVQLTTDKQYNIYIAIADPSAYVAENSAIDKIAKERLYSCYLPGLTVPMLPGNLSEDQCSLLPQVRRAAIVCHFVADNEGNIVGIPTFTMAWIRSCAKLSYNLVSDYLEQKKPSTELNDLLCMQLHQLALFAHLRHQKRAVCALPFQDKENYKFILNEKKAVIDIEKLPRRIANSIVEEAMVTANLLLADFLQTHLGYGIFNAHSGFDDKHIDILLRFLKENDFENYTRDELCSFEGYCQLRRAMRDNIAMELQILRYQACAGFTTDPAPHFGLGFKAYATWTSPLRKYNDLANHRLLKAVLRQKPAKKPKGTLLRALTEKRKYQRYAERELTQCLYTEFLSSQIGGSFAAMVIEINKGGVKVRLLDNGALAFMPLSLIHNKRNEIQNNIGKGVIIVKKNTLFYLGDTIQVLLYEIKSETQTFIVKYLSNATK